MRYIFAIIAISFSILPVSNTTAADMITRTIAVNGTGSASKSPDYATIVVAIVTKAPSAKQAFLENAQKTRDIFATLQKNGIAEDDFVTETIRLDETNNWNVDSDGMQKRSSGYAAKNHLKVTIRDLSKIGSITTALVEAGANDLSDVILDTTSRNRMYDQAREAAFENAQAKAELLASKAGFKIGKVIKINEGADFRVDHRIALQPEPDGVADMPVAMPFRHISHVKATASVGIIWELIE